MNYQETIQYLYDCVPMFQREGASAYKEGLQNTQVLDAHFGHPHRKFRIIHVAGTNGKGSVSHTLAAILQSAGYKVGLYTSPHLLDFRERIRINSEKIPEQYVTDFVERERAFFEPLHPSFFELTTALAFKYFAESAVDVAVIEVGLGGRLDCTNIITPEVSIITNISLEHTQFLGNTLAQIALEKAGIIKPGVPVVIGEFVEDTKPVFLQVAKEQQAPIYWAEERVSKDYPNFRPELQGLFQQKNTQTVLTALEVLLNIGYNIEPSAVYEGFANVTRLTGLMGRWQKLHSQPTILCDTGHNKGGIACVVKQLEQEIYRELHIVIGVVSDKDVRGMLSLLPKTAHYYFTKASVKRALEEHELQHIGKEVGLIGKAYPNVESAVRAAQKNSLPEDFIFVGGSNFIVADLLESCNALNLDQGVLR